MHMLPTNTPPPPQKKSSRAFCASETCDCASNSHQFCIYTYTPHARTCTPPKKKFASILCFRDMRFCQHVQFSPCNSACRYIYIYTPQEQGPPPPKKNSRAFCASETCHSASNSYHATLHIYSPRTVAPPPPQKQICEHFVLQRHATCDSASNCHQFCIYSLCLQEHAPPPQKKKFASILCFRDM